MVHAKTFATNKLTPNELGFLKSLGYKVIDGWTTRGEEPIEILNADRYTTYIVDKRFDKNLIIWIFIGIVKA